MRFWKIFFAAGLLAGLCSCSTTRREESRDAVRPKLPAEVAFNKNAGSGSSLFLMVRGEDGKELSFMLDTGSAETILDRAWEPKLGKRIRTEKTMYGWFGKRTVGIYPAPKLFLGDTELVTGKEVWVDDLSIMQHPGGAPLMGILGMDCLRHYCVQLDFVDGKMRFLDPDKPEGTNRAKAFPLTPVSGQFFLQKNLVGVKGETLIDTADYGDGALDGKRFKQELNQGIPVQMWKGMRSIHLPKGSFGGENYTNLIVEDCSRSSEAKMNIIGLRFLARHRVTFDFPKRMLYLERRYPESQARNTGYALMEEAYKFLMDLKAAGQLPGIGKDEHGDLSAGMPPDDEVYPKTVTFVVTKASGGSKYRFTVVKSAKDGTWKIDKAGP